MPPRNPIDLADRLSRRRALGTAVATLAFLAVQIVARPVFRTDGYGASGPRAFMWALNAGLLLLFLLPIGGFVCGRRVRELVNDELSRANARTAAAAGFGLAMAIALALYALAPSLGWSAREVAYVIVTPATGFTLLFFAWLESRAYAHG